MTQSPLISIALCTYNGQTHLAEQLDSLVNQTYGNTEIIVVDDRSKDNTVDIVKRYMQQYPQIKLHVNPYNLGYQKNFEKAFSLCNGAFILPSDQDDIWTLRKVEELMALVADNLLIYHDSAFVAADGKPLDMKMSDLLNMVDGDDPVPFLFYNCVSGHSMMFSRTLLQHVMPLPRTGVYDHYIAFVAASLGSIKYVPQALVKHRQHEGNATDILGRKKSRSRIKITLERMHRENHWLSICSKTKLNHAGQLAEELYQAGKDRTKNFFNPKFAYLVYKYQTRLMYIPKNKNFKTLSFAIRQAWGAKAKYWWKRR